MLAICNACRYCEGYCAVFPALERRLAFDEHDIHYLANLCHNCGACLYACQYAPPHEFELNFPRVLAQVRKETYEQFAWPRSLRRLRPQRRRGRDGHRCWPRARCCCSRRGMPIRRGFSPRTRCAGVVLRVAAARRDGRRVRHRVRFRDAAFAIASRASGRTSGARRIRSPARSAKRSRRSNAQVSRRRRRWLHVSRGRGHPSHAPLFHHLTFYGFMLCFAATVVATFYHFALGWKAPYPSTSLPVMLGVPGGLGLLAGPAGLAGFDPPRSGPGRSRADRHGRRVPGASASHQRHRAALLALRETRAMGMLLALHLGAVMALFLTLPYGKFVHALYRCRRARALPRRAQAAAAGDCRRIEVSQTQGGIMLNFDGLKPRSANAARTVLRTAAVLALALSVSLPALAVKVVSEKTATGFKFPSPSPTIR